MIVSEEILMEEEKPISTSLPTRFFNTSNLFLLVFLLLATLISLEMVVKSKIFFILFRMVFIKALSSSHLHSKNGKKAKKRNRVEDGKNKVSGLFHHLEDVKGQ